jgi:hypothetical protein
MDFKIADHKAKSLYCDPQSTNKKIQLQTSYGLYGGQCQIIDKTREEVDILSE